MLYPSSALLPARFCLFVVSTKSAHPGPEIFSSPRRSNFPDATSTSFPVPPTWNESVQSWGPGVLFETVCMLHNRASAVVCVGQGIHPSSQEQTCVLSLVSDVMLQSLRATRTGTAHLQRAVFLVSPQSKNVMNIFLSWWICRGVLCPIEPIVVGTPIRSFWRCHCLLCCLRLILINRERFLIPFSCLFCHTPPFLDESTHPLLHRHMRSNQCKDLQGSSELILGRVILISEDEFVFVFSKVATSRRSIRLKSLLSWNTAWPRDCIYIWIRWTGLCSELACAHGVCSACCLWIQ